MHAKIKQKIRFSLYGQSALLGEIEVRHVLPNEFAQAIGPFVFVEHFISCRQPLNGLYEGLVDNRSNPCRGIATLTYVMHGEADHCDSIGNQVRLGSGGIHWTNAGRGIVHHEAIRPEPGANNPELSVFRFWINLPSKYKSGNPDYTSFLPDEIPRKELDGVAGWINILSGEYEDLMAKLPGYSKEFLYHIHLEAKKKFSLITDNNIEYAVFLPSDKAVVNDIEFQAGKLVVFSSQGEIIEIINGSETAVDIILFGGRHYEESIVSEGFFVMNTPHEITQAYNDYYDGKYGQIDLDNQL
jgi:hypothetical protein